MVTRLLCTREMRSLLVSALVVLASCLDAESPTANGPQVVSHVVHVESPVAIPRRYDVLFVIDNSPTIAPHRANLLASYGRMMDVLATLQGGLPNVHIGVTTTSVCDGTGGQLHHTGAVSGAFIVDEKRPDGSRRRNYAGTLANAFRDLANVGASGCPVVEPLAAMRAALADRTTGFVRDDANLAVIFVSASDDQSPLALDDYVAFLTAVHRDPSAVWVAGVSADRDAGCTYAGASAAPAPRLHDLLAQFPNRSNFTSICQAHLEDALALFAGLLSLSVGDPCLPAPLAGPVECAVWYAAPSYERVLRPCEATSSPSAPCWRIVEDPVACPLPPMQRLAIKPGISYPPDHTRIVADCVGE